MPQRTKPALEECHSSLLRCCREWGINPEKGGKDHEIIQDHLFRTVRDKLRETDDDQDDDDDDEDMMNIPKDRVEAIRHVLRVEMKECLISEPKTIRLVIDGLEYQLREGDNVDSILFSSPYRIFRGWDHSRRHRRGDETNGGDFGRDGRSSRGGSRRTTTKTTTRTRIMETPTRKMETRKRYQFKRFSDADLDPLHRFAGEYEETYSPPEFMFFSTIHEDGWIHGMAFEAMVASHAVHLEACYHCKCRRSLRWTGGSATSWKDMTCVRCQSFFEIKSKANQEAIDRAFLHHDSTVLGGSFSRWCKDDVAFRPEREGKDYLVMVSRASSRTRKGGGNIASSSSSSSLLPTASDSAAAVFKEGGESVALLSWRVEIVEIATIYPRFDCLDIEWQKRGNKDSCVKSLRSSAKLLPRTRAVWFQIPRWGPINLHELAEEVFDGLWTEGEYQRASVSIKRRLQNRLSYITGTTEKTEERQPQPRPQPSRQEVVDSLRRDLENLKVSQKGGGGGGGGNHDPKKDDDDDDSDGDDDWETAYNSD